jgi:hypothetical protein
MKPPKRLRNPPKKGFQQKTFDVKKANDHPEAKWPDDSSITKEERVRIVIYHIPEHN